MNKSTASRATCLLLAAAAGAASCGGPGRTDAGACSFELEWGSRSSGDFVPWEDGAFVEVTLGFQGFQFIYSAARLRGVEAADARFSFHVAVDGLEEFVSSSGLNELVPEPGGALVADGILVFFNDYPLWQLVGRTARIEAVAAAGGCVGTHVVEVTLTDDDPCVVPPDGGGTCSDAGL